MYTNIMEIVLDNSQIFKLKRRIYICTNHTAKLKGAEKIMNKNFNKQKGEQKLLYEQLHELYYAEYYKNEP